jgi:AcrR family transcriptional regulator
MTGSDIRQRIIQAAGPIFAQKGFDGTTIREICRKAGVNVAAVNYHFGGKAELYRETVTAAHPVKFTQKPAQLSWPPGTPPQQKLRDFIRTMLERVLQIDPNSWQEELLLREVLNPTPVCHPMIRRYFQTGMELLGGICRELFSTEVPEDVLLRTMLSIVAQCVYYRTARKVLELVLGPQRFRRIADLEALVDHITRFSLAALGHAPPLAGEKLNLAWKVHPKLPAQSPPSASGEGSSGGIAPMPQATNECTVLTACFGMEFTRPTASTEETQPLDHSRIPRNSSKDKKENTLARP